MIFDLNIALDSFIQPFLAYVLDKNEKSIAKKRAAFVALEEAARETRTFIKEQGYKPNINLSKLWMNAFSAVHEAKLFVDSSFPRELAKKAMYWEEPETWHEASGSMELVPKLDFITEQCDVLLEALTKRS